MSSTLKGAIDSLKARIAAAYEAITAKGGTLPATQDSANLPAAIESIPSGGGLDQYDVIFKVDGNAYTYPSFRGNTRITSAYLENTANTTNFTSMANMFHSCSSLQSVDLSNLDTTNVISTAYLFYNCSSLQSVYLSNLDTTNVTTMLSMFYGCSSLLSIDVSNWNVSNVTNMSGIFQGCSSLLSIDVSNWNVSNVTNMQKLFYGCSSLLSIDVSNWNVSNVTNMSGIFQGCSSLQTLDLSNWDTVQNTNLDLFMDGCINLESIDVSFDTSNVINMNNIFNNCPKLKSLDLRTWDISKASFNSSTFRQCSSLTSLRVGQGWTRGGYSLYGTGLVRDGLVQFFNDLPTISTAQTITLNRKMSLLSAEDIAIATGKGWTLA